ncbi:MAG TPA: hypothetical protein VFK38_01375 [Candidatus Limnocylindrales bacterium]|nr:hypothetical protein [Candidatus Limnocylindrales bacterium]
MAVRLHLKYGLVSEQDRLEDSPDTILVTEPTIGSVLRSKGSLFTVVTARPGSSGRPDEASALIAETVRREYYYDESAGIPICLEKALRSANRRLRHQREGHGLARGAIGAVVAVVRGHELYVATIGDAEAYLVRQARLLTLPEEERGEGLPTPDELHVDVWRGEISVGDTLVLVSRNLTETVGTDELKNAVVTLHPQSAVEHLHHLFVAAGGSGSDAVLTVEATEVPATRAQRKLVPVRPAEPLAGAPDRSPIPLAEPLAGAATAVQVRARDVRSAVSGGLYALFDRLTDLLPRRRTRYRRVTPLASRRETQRRAAVAVLALLGVVTGLAVVAWLLGGALSAPTDRVIEGANLGERALAAARERVGQVFGDGADLVASDQRRALALLREAWQELDTAERAGIRPSQLAALRAEVAAGLDRIYRISPVDSSVLYSFTKLSPEADPSDLVIGPDGAAYSIDTSTKSVVRVDLARKSGVVVAKAGMRNMGEPWLLAASGPDLVVLDRGGLLWRWRPSDTKGKGTLGRIRVGGDTTWGDDVTDIGTYLRNADAGLYNVYVVDPSSRQILRYSPTLDGNALTKPVPYLATAGDVSDFRQLYIDTDVYAMTGQRVIRHEGGRADDFALGELPDDVDLRPGHDWSAMAATGGPKQGRIYLWDARHRRIVVFSKASGELLEQFRAGSTKTDFSDIRGMVVREREGGASPLLYWVSGARLLVTPLEPATAPGASSSPSGSPGSSPTSTSPGPSSPASP